jgi:hypothetical protein
MNDDQAERDLRIRVCDELESVLSREGIGGVVLVVSKTHAAWRLVLPEWVAIIPGAGRWIVQLRGSTAAGRERTENTFHFMGVLRDMSHDANALFGRLFRLGKSQVELGGGVVEHEPFGGGNRLDPEGGKRS